MASGRVERMASPLHESGVPGENVTDIVARSSTLERALAVLEWLAEREESGHTVRAIAVATGMPKTTVHRLLELLQRRGWVVQAPDDTYDLGLTALRVGAAVIRHLDVVQAIRPIALRLRDETGETVFTTVLDGRSLLIVDKFESPSPIRFARPVGARSIPHANAAGKALLARLSDTDLDHYLAQPLETSTLRTVTDPDVLRRDLRAISACGYAVVDEESLAGVLSIGAVVTDYLGEARAAISVAGPRERMRDRQDGLVQCVLAATDEASRSLGATAAH